VGKKGLPEKRGKESPTPKKEKAGTEGHQATRQEKSCAGEKKDSSAGESGAARKVSESGKQKF